MAEIEIYLNKKTLVKVINDSDELRASMEGHVSRMTANANAMGAGFRTQRTIRYATGERVGGKQPEYVGDVQKRRGTLVGIVRPNNYAAMKDNYEHNTLLKSI